MFLADTWEDLGKRKEIWAFWTPLTNFCWFDVLSGPDLWSIGEQWKLSTLIMDFPRILQISRSQHELSFVVFIGYFDSVVHTWLQNVQLSLILNLFGLHLMCSMLNIRSCCCREGEFVFVWTPKWVMGSGFASWGSSSWASWACLGNQFCQRWNETERLAFLGGGAQWLLAALCGLLLWCSA